ncbi:hypothetical protein ACFLZG_07405 [Thermodesulfobacteriota bacterium]
MAKKVWMYKPKKESSPKAPELIKTQLKSKAVALIENVLKPKYIKPPPKDNDFNYLVDIFSKWHGLYFYFCSKYNCPRPRALSPSFEDKFARLEYVGPDKFNLAYKRHTGQWVEIFSGLSLEECFSEIEEGVHFAP